MPTPDSPTRRFVCGRCRAVLTCDTAQAGEKCRCGRCGTILVIPDEVADRSAASESTVTLESLEPPVPQDVDFFCQVCDTRLVADVADVGKKLKCPDCGKHNVIPAPRKPAPKQIPPAMQGVQYQVLSVDEAPPPDAQRAAQAQLFPVYCRVCDTLMYALPKHVGRQLKCPDCGSLTVVKAPPPTKKPKSPLVAAGQEYQLDPADAVADRPAREDIERLQERSRSAVEAEARKREEERPNMPPLPTLQGVWPMLTSEPVPTWWVGLSAAGMAVAWLLANSVTLRGGAAFTEIAALMFRITGAVGFVLWYGPLTSCLCAVLSQSSDGLKKLHQQPSPFFMNCLPEMAYVGIAFGVSMIPALAMMNYVPWQYSMAAAGSMWALVFPVLLLSALEEGSSLAVFCPRIWASLLVRPGHWLVFYAESAGLVTAIGTAAVACTTRPRIIYLSVPLVLAGLLIYFRVLGRFGWWLNESLPERDASPK